MIRLEKHSEIVEAMARALYRHPIEPNDGLVWSQQLATAALDAMLEAVVRLEVGQEARHWVSHAGNECVIVDDARANALILKLEPTT